MLATTTTDCYVLIAEFITADKIKNCPACEIKLSSVYAVKDVDNLIFSEPECLFVCGVGK